MRRIHITASTLRIRTGEQVDRALSGALVEIRRHDRPVAYLLSHSAVEQAPQLKAALARLCPGEPTDA